MVHQTTSSLRRYDLDWLRVLAIVSIFVFHSGRFFDLMDWHVKSAAVYAPAQAWINFLAGWLMPLIFIISGASLFYTVGKVGCLGFIRDKVLRLLVPLLFGVFTYAAVGVYLERRTHAEFSGSFIEFYPHYFDGMYGFGGNFAWMGLYLWYLLVLSVFSLAFMPLFYLLKGVGRGLLNKVGDFLAAPGLVLVLVLPVALLSAILEPGSTLGQRNFGGWPLPVKCVTYSTALSFSRTLDCKGASNGCGASVSPHPSLSRHFSCGSLLILSQDMEREMRCISACSLSSAQGAGFLPLWGTSAST
jgi:hypothetical protein